MKKLIKLTSLTIILFILSSCGSNISYQSLWTKNSIEIDGDYEEWTGTLQYIENSNIGYGIQNDDQNLYVCLVSNNQRFNRDIFMKGLTVWFDIKGKKNKHAGIKFPVGIPPQLRRNMMRNKNENNSNINFYQTEFEFFTNKKEKTILPVYNNDKNIELKLNRRDKSFVYEIKIPFTTLGKNENDNISVGLELGKFDKPNLQNNARSGGMGKSGAGGRSGGRNGGRSGGGRGGMTKGNRPGNQQAQTTFEKWIKIDIAKDQN